VVLQADNSEQMHRKFTRFFISIEAENANETADVGVFDLQDDAMTKFADNCANAVVETSKVQKEEISVAWTSPIEGSGCIILRWRDILIIIKNNIYFATFARRQFKDNLNK